MRSSLAGLLASFVAIGALAVVHQTILVREFLVVFSGNELAVGLVFAGWLTGVTIGAWCGGFLGKRFDLGNRAFFLGTIAFLAAGPISILLVRDARSLFDIPVGQYAPFLKLALGALLIGAPSAFFVGFLFPIAGGVADRIGLSHKSIGSVYTFEALGAAVGGLVFTFFLAGKTDHFTTLALFMLGVSIALSWYLVSGRKFGRAIVASGLACLILATLIAGGWLGLDQIGIKIRWNLAAPGVELLESRDSKYQNIAVGKIAEQISVYGNGEVITSFPDPTTYRTKANLLASQHPSPTSALLIGAGAEGLVRFLLPHGIRRIDLVETDAVATSMIQRYLSPEDKQAITNPGIGRYAVDGRYFVDHTENKYDLIVIEMPDPSTAMINRYYTRDFLESVSDRLTEQGVLSLSVTSAANYLGQDVGLYTGSIFRTLNAIFSNVAVGPGDVASFFASDSADSCTDDWTVLQRRYQERCLPEDDFSTVMFKVRFPPNRVKLFRSSLESYSDARINTDTTPITYFYNLLLWDRFASGNFGSALRAWSRAGLTWVLIAIGVLGLLASGAVYYLNRVGSAARSAKLRSAWTIGATGFAGMGLEVLLLLAYQNVHGSLYERIGLLIALYMLGLALGGALATKLDHAQRNTLVWLTVADASLVVAAITLSWILLFTMPQAFFFIAVFLIASIAGVQFPLAASLIQYKKENVVESAGFIDWADHLGALFGAATAGVLLIPVFGLRATCLVVAALKATSLLGLLANRANKQWYGPRKNGLSTRS